MSGVLANFEMNLTWKDLLTRTARETMSDDAQGLASQLVTRWGAKTKLA